MIDLELLRSNPELVKTSAKNRGVQIDAGYILEVDEKRRKLIQEVDELRAGHNRVSDLIAKLSGEERAKAIEESREAKDRIGHKEFELKAVEVELEELMQKIPNMPLPEAPIGASEAENVVLREVGEKPSFDFEPKDHVALGTALDIIDFESGSKVSGSGFFYLKREGALLELALVQYALDFICKRGFVPYITPDLARKEFYVGTGYTPKGPEAQTFEIKDSDLGLIATAEVTLAGIHAGEILDGASLPRLYAGYSHCFRQEAGAYGKYSKGIYRVHQFTKVEMFAYTKPEESKAMHEELLQIEEELWQGLKIPYRVLDMCTGDLGAQAARKFDLEAWMPGRGDWGEVTSTSNTTDYQARNLKIRYKAAGKNEYVHMLNGTAVSTARAIIAILENYQNADGSVTIPEALRPFMSGIETIRREAL